MKRWTNKWAAWLTILSFVMLAAAREAYSTESSQALPIGELVQPATTGDQAEAKPKTPSRFQRLIQQFLPQAVDVRPQFTDPNAEQTPGEENVETNEDRSLASIPEPPAFSTEIPTDSKPLFPAAGLNNESENTKPPSSVTGNGGSGSSFGGSSPTPAGSGSGVGQNGNLVDEGPTGFGGTPFGQGGGSPIQAANDGGQDGNGAGEGATGEEGTGHPLMYEMCMFFDGGAIPQSMGNEVIQGLVKRAHDCGVNLVVHPYTVRPGSYPNPGESDDPTIMEPAADEIVRLQEAACNITDISTADRASTSMCVDNTYMAEAMCRQKEPDPSDPTGKRERLKHDTAGCAGVAAGEVELPVIERKRREKAERLCAEKPDDPSCVDETVKKLKEDEEEHNPNKVNTAGGATGSIEDRDACDAGTVSHEAIGHSMFGHPNGKGDGHGIGFDDGPDRGDGWTGEGCAAMRRNAFDNPMGSNGKRKYQYFASKTNYWNKVENPELQIDLQNTPPLFGPANNPPAGPTGGGGRQLAGVTGGSRVLFDDSQKRPNNNTNSSSSGTPVQETAGPGSRHKKVGGGSPADQLLAGLADNPAGDNRPSIDDETSAKDKVEEGNGGGFAPSITFDDNIKRRTSAGGGGSNLDPTDALASVASPGGSASVSQNPGSYSTGFGSGGGRSTVGFDDSRKRGANGDGSQGSSGGPGYTGGDSLVVGGGGANISTGAGGFESALEEGFFEGMSREEQERKRNQFRDWRRRPDQGGYGVRPRLQGEL